MREFLKRVFGVHRFIVPFVFVFDGIWAGMPMLSVIVVFGLFVAVVVVLGLSIARRALPSRLVVARIGIYLLLVAAVSALLRIDNSIAENRATEVAAAIKSFRVKYNHYPETLDKLVPEFLPVLRKAKPIALQSNGYYYKVMPEGDVLFFYTIMSPFDRRSYDFKRDAWSEID
jgi:hypothetical protein